MTGVAIMKRDGSNENINIISNGIIVRIHYYY